MQRKSIGTSGLLHSTVTMKSSKWQFFLGWNKDWVVIHRLQIRTYEDRNRNGKKLEIRVKKNQQMFFFFPRTRSYGRFFYRSKIIAFLLFHVTLGGIKVASTLRGIKFREQSRQIKFRGQSCRIKFRGQSQRRISGQVICMWLQQAATFTPSLH